MLRGIVGDVVPLMSAVKLVCDRLIRDQSKQAAFITRNTHTHRRLYSPPVQKLYCRQDFGDVIRRMLHLLKGQEHLRM